MKFLFVPLLLILHTNVIAQSVNQDFFDNRCDFKSNGLPKAKGLKITLSVPCKWTRYEGRRPHVLVNFTYHFQDDSYLTSQLLVEKPSIWMGKKSINDVSDKDLKDYCQQFGSISAIRRTKIGGLPAIEYTGYGTVELPIAYLYISQLTYQLIYDRALITITYSTVSTNPEQSKTLSENYRFLFKYLAGLAIVNNVFIK